MREQWARFTCNHQFFFHRFLSKYRVFDTMWEAENDSGIVRKIKHRISQQQITDLLRVCYALFLICMVGMIWQFIALNFEYMMIALVLGLVVSQIALAIEKFLYEGDQLRWGEFLGR